MWFLSFIHFLICINLLSHCHNGVLNVEERHEFKYGCNITKCRRTEAPWRLSGCSVASGWQDTEPLGYVHCYQCCCKTANMVKSIINSTQKDLVSDLFAVSAEGSTHATGPSCFMILTAQSKVLLYLWASRPCRMTRRWWQNFRAELGVTPLEYSPASWS